MIYLKKSGVKNYAQKVTNLNNYFILFFFQNVNFHYKYRNRMKNNEIKKYLSL